MTDEKLTQLTPEQEEQIPGWIEKWTEIGLSTEPADWATAIEGIHEEYRLAGLEPPDKLICLGSPLAAACAAAHLTNEKFPKKRIGKKDTLANIVGRDTQRQLKLSVKENLDAITKAEAQQHRAFTEIKSFKIKGDPLYETVRDLWSSYIGGSFWASWPAFTSFFREVCGVELSNCRELSTKSCGWWYPLDGAA